MDVARRVYARRELEFSELEENILRTVHHFESSSKSD